MAVVEAISAAVGSVFSFLETENQKDIVEQQWLNDSIPEYGFYVQPQEQDNSQLYIIAMVLFTIIAIAFFFFFRKQ